MSGIEQIIEVMTAPPAPAAEVVTLDRATLATILVELEAANPLRSLVSDLRAKLAEPKVELWAMHSVGPGEVYPCLNKEDAERQAQELRDLGVRMKAARIAKGECVEMWGDWAANVIPSPWEPDEHFEIMAEEWQTNHQELAEHTTKLQAENDALRKSLGGMLFAFDDGVGREWSADLLDHARKLCPAAEFKP
ncbi:hypothetical protein [Pseudomonas tussilaginis]|uniref:hypothetical protein n=1 Tax=Pseudomonas putida TaxID=303 RepID=UPI0023644B52|nr:hypothetical protein [Pseudomonas putida]MDD1977159.1 hypothetical protein [Pseudomonas putida]